MQLDRHELEFHILQLPELEDLILNYDPTQLHDVLEAAPKLNRLNGIVIDRNLQK